MDEGDFLRRCLPRTHGYYKSRPLPEYRSPDCPDRFDAFVRDRVPFFRFLIDQFYQHKRTAMLQLAHLAEPKILNHLDELLFQFLATDDQTTYQQAKDIYMFMLESCVVRSAVPKEPS